VIKNQVEIAIVGGGLIGMLTAYALVKSGADVAVIEKSASALESSWAGGGILSPLYPWRYPDAVNELAFKSQHMYASLVDDIQRESGIDPQYRQCGMSILADDMDEAAYHWLRDHKITYTDSAPDWNRVESRRYVYLPQIAQIRNPRFIKSLMVALEKRGVEFSFNNTVSAFEKSENGEFLLSTAKGQWQAKRIIICAGAWTAKLLGNIVPTIASEVAPEMEINPVRGQMLLYLAPETLISSIILSKGKYIIPRKDGRVLVGSTMENAGFNKATTGEAKFELKAFVEDICPVLSQYPIEQHWSGLRPGSPDGTPFIGEHPQISGLYINSGHFRNGVVMAPASAQLMCDLIQGNRTSVDPEAYALAR